MELFSAQNGRFHVYIYIYICDAMRLLVGGFGAAWEGSGGF